VSVYAEFELPCGCLRLVYPVGAWRRLVCEMHLSLAVAESPGGDVDLWELELAEPAP
jgi:hypothetical protein